MNKNLIAVYGSLRPGAYNYDRFKDNYAEGIEPFSSTVYKVPGYKLYDLGSYPGINEGTENDVLSVNILACNDKCHQSIMNMELGAGYSAKEITVDGIKVIIYIYDHPGNPLRLVTSGDWLEHLELKRNKNVSSKKETQLEEQF